MGLLDIYSLFVSVCSFNMDNNDKAPSNSLVSVRAIYCAKKDVRLFCTYLIGQLTLFGCDLVLEMKTLDEIDCVVQRGPAYWSGRMTRERRCRRQESNGTVCRRM